jgi:hypothetical protein
MKNLIILSSIALMISCGSECEKSCKKPIDSNSEIETLTIKLEATEAQLLNVSAELSKCKGTDSSFIKNDKK